MGVKMADNLLFDYSDYAKPLMRFVPIDELEEVADGCLFHVTDDGYAYGVEWDEPSGLWRGFFSDANLIEEGVSDHIVSYGVTAREAYFGLQDYMKNESMWFRASKRASKKQTGKLARRDQSMDKHIKFQGQEYLFVYEAPESTWTFPDHGDYTCKLDSGYSIVIMCKAYVGWFWVIYDKDWNTVANGSDGGWYDSDKRYYKGEEIEQCAKSALLYCMIKSLASSKKQADSAFTYAEQKFAFTFEDMKRQRGSKYDDSEWWEMRGLEYDGSPAVLLLQRIKYDNLWQWYLEWYFEGYRGDEIASSAGCFGSAKSALRDFFNRFPQYCTASKKASKKNATRSFTYAEQKELEDEVIDKPWLNNADRLKDPDILLSF